MKNTVLLVRPRNVYNYNNYPALGLISLATCLQRAGLRAKIINCAFSRDALQEIARELPQCLCVAVTLLTSECPDAYRIMEFVKETSAVPVVAGGWHCTLFPEQMEASGLADYVVVGEGEKHLLSIAETLRRGGRPERRVFAKENIDLDLLPEPQYDIDTDIEKFITSPLTDKLCAYVRRPMRWLPYESSRGCPSLCTFCINVVADNNRYRKKNADKVVDEVERIVSRHRLTHLKIIDDNFFVDIQRVRKICQGFIDRKLGISWDGECRCDYFNESMINDATLRLLRESGLAQLTLGIESGSTRTLQLMRKGIVPAQAERAVAQCDRYGIVARSSFILEIPGEAVSDIRQTVSFINRLRRYRHYTCGVNTFRPYPKCELTAGLQERGYLREPRSFREWTDQSVIDLYTAAEYVRPWQVAPLFSESAAYYLSMQSSVRLGAHQLTTLPQRAVNALFVALASVRNAFMYYRFPFEKRFYQAFLKSFYRRQAQKDSREGRR